MKENFYADSFGKQNLMLNLYLVITAGVLIFRDAPIVAWIIYWSTLFIIYCLNQVSDTISLSINTYKLTISLVRCQAWKHWEKIWWSIWSGRVAKSSKRLKWGYRKWGPQFSTLPSLLPRKILVSLGCEKWLYLHTNNINKNGQKWFYTIQRNHWISLHLNILAPFQQANIHNACKACVFTPKPYCQITPL